MMTSTRKETNQSSSLHQKIRKAEFIKVEKGQNESFKYVLVYKLKHRFNKLLDPLKKLYNKYIERISIFMSTRFKLEEIKNDSFVWFVEVLIEGITANFTTRVLFGVPINLFTILAHGIFIKQGLSIHRRLKNNGPNPEIPKQHK